MKTPEREGREKRTQDIFEIIMTKNFLKLMSDTKPQIQEVQRTPNRINALSPKNDVQAYYFQITEKQR